MLKRLFPLFAIFLFLFSCNSKEATKNSFLKINLGSEPHTLDPRMARDMNSLTLMRVFFEGLTRIHPNDRPELALASSVEISKDLKTYTFKLRNTKWSNGDALVAGDFVYTWRQILSPSFPADNAFQLFVLKNGKAIKEGKLEKEALGVNAVDDQTLVIELEQPTPYFLELLAFPVFFPVNPRIDQTSSQWAQKENLYVSNGPFSLRKWNHHDGIIVEKNPSYWDASQVKLEGIEFLMVSEDAEMKLFEKKELHWAGSPLSTIGLDLLPTLKKNGMVHMKPVAGTSFLRVNVTSKSLENEKLRKALSIAIDRESIAEHILQGGGQPAHSFVPPQLFSQTNMDNGLTSDLQLSDEDRHTKIVLTYCSSERANLIAQTLQQQWKEALGLDIALEGVEKKVYFDRISHQDYQISLGSWFADYNDPANFLDVFKYKTQSTNNTNWEDPAYIQTLNDANVDLNENDRLKLLKKCENILLNAAPIIPIYHSTMLYLKDEKLHGVFLSSLGHLDFKWANLDNPE